MIRYRRNAFLRSSQWQFFFGSLFFCLLLFSVFGGPGAWGATYTVTNTSNDGPGSLRLAILSANTNPGPDTINFSIPGCGAVCSISLRTPLPLSGASGSNTTIDGYTQTGSAPPTATTPAVPKIEINGLAIGANNCFNISSAGNVIRGLAINGCTANGVSISGSGATGNRISGNLIGTNYNGFSDNPNTFSGVFIGSGAWGNTIGGAEVSDRNLISGNLRSGIEISGLGTNNNVVSGNYIGTFPSGNTALPNVQNGIRIYNGAQFNIIGGETEGQRNLISGNANAGVLLEGVGTDNNTISGNFVGTNAAGTGPVGNVNYGIYMSEVTHNTIGGATPGRRNIISGNVGFAIYLTSSDWNTISGNYIGTDFTGMTALANGNDAIDLNGSNNTIGGDTPEERNIISGNTSSAIQVYGVSTPTNYNVIKGNYIGLAADGLTPLPNTHGGVYLLDNVNFNTVGGGSPGQRNVISGNTGSGVLIYGASSDAVSNTVAGNYIGTDASGRVAVGNSSHGVYIGPRAKNNLIGGDLPGSGNVISGNGFGITIEGQLGINNVTANTVKNNYIGTDALGLNRLGNTLDGITITTNAKNSVIGPGNMIAFNGGDGIQVDTPTTTGHFIIRNRVFGNGDQGIRLTNGANGLIPAPVIQNTGISGSIIISGKGCAGCAVEVFSSRGSDGEGEVYLGFAMADGAGDFSLATAGLPYPYLTATATDGRGTSEFSAPFTSTAFLLRLPLVVR